MLRIGGLARGTCDLRDARWLEVSPELKTPEHRRDAEPALLVSDLLSTANQQHKAGQRSRATDDARGDRRGDDSVVRVTVVPDPFALAA